MAYYNRGCVFRTLGHYDLAIAEFNKTIAVSKDKGGHCQTVNLMGREFEVTIKQPKDRDLIDNAKRNIAELQNMDS